MPPTARDAVDILGRMRYGDLGAAGKEALAAAGTLPGAPDDRTADLEMANRYAAGYLFTQQHPMLAQYAIPAASLIHALAGDSASVQSQAHAGMNRALTDIENQRRWREMQAYQAANTLIPYAAMAAGR